MVELWVATGEGASGGPEVRSLQTARAHDGCTTAVASSPSHPNAFVSGGADGRVRFWDASTVKLVASVDHAHVGGVAGVAVHPVEGHTVATVGGDGAVRVWDARAAAADGKPALHRAGDDIRRRMGKATAVEWCRAGACVAAGYEAGEVCFLDVDAGELHTRGVVRAHEDAVRALAWDDTSQRLASCGDDHVTACHSGEVPTTAAVRAHGENYARAVAWGAARPGGEDARVLYSGGWDGAVRTVVV